MPEESKAVTIIEPNEIQSFNLPDSRTLKNKLEAIQHFQSLVQQSLIKGMDYGEIPGVAKPSLFQPGAEKIAKLLELAEYYEMVTEIEDWDKGFFYYKIKCVLKMIGTDIVISQGLGSANSKEPKFAYRWLWPGDVPQGMDKTKMVTRRTKKGGLQYRMNNEEIFEIVNTILKMGKKRAFIDAVKSAGRLSNLFTQDIEDMTASFEDDVDIVNGEAEDITDKPDLGKCPECSSDLITRSGKYGDFVACSGYPKCQYKPPKDKGKSAAGETPQTTTNTTPAVPEQQIDRGDDVTMDWSKVTQAEYFKELDRIILEKGLPATMVKVIMKPFGYSKRTEISIAKRIEVLQALMEA